MAGEESFPVHLNIYDLSQGMARQLSAAILGTPIDAVYHTAVVVYGKEYWFGAGIEQGIPGRTYFGPPLRRIKLGDTSIPQEIFLEYLRDVSSNFNVATYSLLQNNCNHFSEEVSQFLVGSSIPAEILDLPNIVARSPNGRLLVPLLQNMEDSLRQGHVPVSPFAASAASAPVTAFGPQVSATRSPAAVAVAGASVKGQAGGAERTETTREATNITKLNTVSVAASSHVQSAPGSVRTKSAKEQLEEEIRKEFALLMALGNIGANEAAAEALRRVTARRQPVVNRV